MKMMIARITLVDVKRILSNDLSILCSRSNEGKSQSLINIIKDYKKVYNGKIWTFGIPDSIAKKLGVMTFKSLTELEEIRGSIIIIDEAGTLFDFDNKKKRKQIDTTLRIVNHSGNKILLSGLASDFNRYVCSKAKCFMFKALLIGNLIQGSYAKEVVNQYEGNLKGTFVLRIPKNKMLCFDKNFWEEDISYYPEYDLKLKNVDLFKCHVGKPLERVITKKNGSENGSMYNHSDIPPNGSENGTYKAHNVVTNEK